MAGITSARATRPQWAFHLATLGGAGLMVALTVPRTYFVNDDWSFVGPLANGQVGWVWFFLPQNEHLVLFPKLLFAGLGSLFGFASSVPFVTVTVSLHLVLCHLLWRLALANGASATVSALGVAGFAVYGAGVENILWAFQVGLVGSMVLGVLLLLEVSRGRPRALVVTALAVANVLTTGLALVFLALATVILLTSRRPRWVLALVPAGFVLLVWFLLVRPRSSASGLALDHAVLLPVYWILGIGTAVTAPLPILRAHEVLDLGMSLQSLGFALAGCVALLVVLLVAERRRLLEGAALAKIFAWGCPVFVVLTSVPRIASGLPIALSSRYAYVATAFLVPVVLLLLSRLGTTRGRMAAVLVGTAVIAMGNLVLWVPMAHAWNSRAQARLVTMAAGKDLSIRGLPGYDSTPPAPEFAMLSGQELLALSFPNDLPAPDRRDVLTATMALQVSVTPSPAVTAQNCGRPVRSTELDLETGRGAVIKVPATMAVTMQLVEADGARSNPRLQVLTAGQYVITSSGSAGHLLLATGDGEPTLVRCAEPPSTP